MSEKFVKILTLFYLLFKNSVISLKISKNKKQQ